MIGGDPGGLSVGSQGSRFGVVRFARINLRPQTHHKSARWCHVLIISDLTVQIPSSSDLKPRRYWRRPNAVLRFPCGHAQVTEPITTQDLKLTDSSNIPNTAPRPACTWHAVARCGSNQQIKEKSERGGRWSGTIFGDVCYGVGELGDVQANWAMWSLLSALPRRVNREANQAQASQRFLSRKPKVLNGQQIAVRLSGLVTQSLIFISINILSKLVYITHYSHKT